MTTCDHHGEHISSVAFVCHCNQPCCYNPRGGCTCPVCNCDDHHQVRTNHRQPKGEPHRRNNRAPIRWV